MGVGEFFLNRDFSRGVTESEETASPSAFGFECVDGECWGVEAALILNMVFTPSNGPILPSVDYIENQRDVDGNCRVKATGGLPGSKTDPAHKFSLDTRR